MSHDVSSWFINEAGKSSISPIREFTIGSSDYSDYIIKWPKFKQAHNTIRPVTLSVKLANEDQSFNFIKNDTTLLTAESQFKMGFKGTNLFAYSEQFDNAAWTLQFSSVVADSEVAPNGATTADTLTDADAGNYGYMFQAQQVSFDVTRYYSAFIYIKKDSTARSTRFALVFLYFFGAANEYNEISLDTSTGDVNLNEVSGDGDMGVESAGDYWRVYFIKKSVNQSNTNVRLQVYPAAGASSNWSQSAAATGSITIWGAQITKSDDIRLYNKIEASTEINDDELITMFTGKMERVKYQDGSCAISFVDKFKQLTERLIGTSDTPVTYTGSNYLPADIAWYAITSYGGYDTTATSANIDIDYESWLAWSDVFSADAVFVNAHFDGKKVGEVLKKIANYTDSAIYVHDNKIRFKRFSLTDSNQTLFDSDSIRKLSVAIDNRDVINKMYVQGDYDVTSKYWKLTANDEVAASVSSYGLKEQTIKDTNLWYVNSGSAINLAQRKTLAVGVPYDKLKVETTLKGLPRIIGETISVTDLSVGVSEGYRIMGQEIDMDSGKLSFMADRSYFSDGFILDTSTLGSAAILT